MRDLTHEEDGFTLVELLVAMSLSLIVLFAVLQSLDTFTSEAAKQTRVTDANDQVRRTMERVVNDLRGASVLVTGSTSTSLVYSVPEPPVPPATSRVRTERLCLDPVSTDLYSFTSIDAVPTDACSTGIKLANLKSTTRTTFTYDGSTAPASLATVKNVGLTFSLDASGGGRAGGSTLKASAAVRRTVAMLPAGPPDVPITCPSAGPLIKIDAGVAFAEDVAVAGNVGPLSVSYLTELGATIALGGTVDPKTGSPLTPLGPLAKGTRIVVKIVDSLNIVRALIPKTVECDYS